jgi:glucokinase
MKALGIDIGGTRIKAGVVDEQGNILEQRTGASPRTLEEFRETVNGLVTGLHLGELAGIGAGCKGIVNPSTTTIEVLPGTLHFLEGLTLAGFLPAGLPVFADNDARVAMAGELVWGAARGRSEVLMLTLGTGVGGAIVTAGKLLRGSSGVAGHIGHYTVDPDGPVCICGNHGCLETYFAAPAIETAAAGAVRRGVASSLTESFGRAPEKITCQAVFAAAAIGDPLAARIISQAVRKLAGAISGLLFALDPEIVILGGQIIQAGPLLFDPLSEEVRWRTRTMMRREVPIVPQQMADPSGILGAAALVFAGARG